MIYYYDLVQSVSNGVQIDAIYTDIKKAFDTINIDILINKLGIIGVSDPILSWFKSYLSDRTQKVKIGNSISKNIYVTSGVPQGGHLSPLLFILFINDINYIFRYCKFALFADDLKIYMPISSLEDSNNLQYDLDQLNLWCVRNGLNLNTDKCFQITFTRNKQNFKSQYHLNNKELVILTKVKDLGIIFSSDLTFTEHINVIFNKALRVFGFLSRNCWEFHDPLCLRVLYFSLVRSILDYGSIIWSPHQDYLIIKLERLQNRFLRMLAFKTNKVDQTLKSLAIEFNIEILEFRRQFNDLRWLYNLLNSKIDCPEILSLISFNVPNITLRSTLPFYIPTYKRNYCLFAPVNRMLMLGNKMKNVDFFSILFQN
jgi:hypothetical protein